MTTTTEKPRHEATAKATTSAYRIRHGAVYLQNVKVGSVDEHGHFTVTGPDGQVHAGNLGALIRADVRAQILRDHQGPSGRLRVGAQQFDVRGGAVFLNAKRIGSLDLEGHYRFTCGDRVCSGNTNRTPGAVWLADRPTSHASGRIELAGKSFVAIDGVIFEEGEAIGWLREDGQFRGVTKRGDHFEGSQQHPERCLYLTLMTPAAPPATPSPAPTRG